MKFLLSIILSAVLCFLTQTLLMELVHQWWTFAIVIFVVALLIRQSSGRYYFLSGMIPVFAVWLFLLYRQDAPNDALLSDKIATLFSMPNHHILFVVVSLVMGIIGGLAALAGGSLRKKSN